MDLYIGLMSGTSADGIDAALVDFSQPQPKVIATHYAAYSSALQEQIHALCDPGADEIQRLGELDIILGRAFADAANALLKQQSLSPEKIKAIGSHGQTVRHFPHHPHRFSLQIGDPNTIATQTGITTVADFRRKDIACGGQGAPLVPAFHQSLLATNLKDRVIVNIGGIANITLLPKASPDDILGYDTGPGNVLMDTWIKEHKNKAHDAGGTWAASGRVHKQLLELFLSDLYFDLAPPKSTGREHFNQAWLKKQLREFDDTITPADVQATLAELTAVSILDAVRNHLSTAEILICGGGVKNTYLMSRLTELANPEFSVASTELYGVDPDWVEAMAFAWLAKQTLHRLPGNVPSVTGARQAAVLGGVYYS